MTGSVRLKSAREKMCDLAGRGRVATRNATRSDIAESELLLRFGLHWGSTLYVGRILTRGRSEVTAFGDEMNETARIEVCATGGRTLASKALIERLDRTDAGALGIDTAHANIRFPTSWRETTDFGSGTATTCRKWGSVVRSLARVGIPIEKRLPAPNISPGVVSNYCQIAIQTARVCADLDRTIRPQHFLPRGSALHQGPHGERPPAVRTGGRSL
jgi:hypothetical protein